MMNKNTAERPNRVVTCQVCGVQMPQRYLARHMRGHNPVPDKPPAGASENELVPEETQDRQVLNNAGPKQPAGVLICPACADFVAENDFTNHMQAQHTNWCPLCHAQTKNLAEHLRGRHLLKPIQPPPLYERGWETQKRFICLGCKKKVSVWSYPKHEQPHGATRGLAQQKGIAPTYKAPRPPAPENTQPAAETVVCSFCQQEVAKSFLAFHLGIEHPACPYCHQRQPRQGLTDHIQTMHPGERLPE